MSAYLLDLWEEPLATCAVYLLIRDVDYSLILHYRSPDTRLHGCVRSPHCHTEGYTRARVDTMAGIYSSTHGRGNRLRGLLWHHIQRDGAT